MIPLLLAPLLSSLAASGMSLLSSAIQAKGKEVIEEKLGIKIPANPAELTPELLAKIKEKEMEHEEFLLEIQVKQAEISLAEKSLFVDDTKDARKLGMELSKSAGFLNQNIMPFLALVTIFGGTAILLLSKEADTRMAAVSMMTLVLGYFFGSSQGSKNKQLELDKIHQIHQKGGN